MGERGCSGGAELSTERRFIKRLVVILKIGCGGGEESGGREDGKNIYIYI